MKRLSAILLAALFLIASVLPASALELSSVESAEEFVLPETSKDTGENISVLSAVEAKPGLNVINGLETPVTFDGENDLTGFAKDNYHVMEIGTFADKDGNEDNKVLHLHRDAVDSHWSNLNYPGYSFPGDGRKYAISFDHYFKMNDVKTAWGALVYLNSVNPEHISVSCDRDKWIHTSTTVTPKKTYLQFRHRLGTVNAENAGTQTPLDAYFDNFAIYPYYKITYVVPGRDDVVDQVLFDAEGNLLKTYDIPADKMPESFTLGSVEYTPIGWALTPDASAEDVVTSVALANEDVTLYLICNTTAGVTYDKKYANAAAGNTITLTASFDADWSVDVGYTDATYEATDKTLTITSAGLDGEIHVTVTSKTSGMVYEETVFFAGSKIVRPGLNLLTGTKNPYTFEDVSLADVALVFGSPNPDLIVENPEKTDVNNSSSMVYWVYGGDYPQLWTRSFNSYSVERPTYFSYDYCGSFDNHWLMINGSGPNDIFRDVKTNNGLGPSESWRKAKVYSTSSDKAKHTQSSRFAIEVAKPNGYYVDNISIIPAYKISYMSLEDPTVEAACDYALVDENNNLLPYYTVKNTIVDGVVGYALEPDGERVLTVPLGTEDIVLYPLANVPLTFTDGENAANVELDETADFVFPSPDELGLKAEHFAVWLAEDGTHYPVGTVIPVDQLDTVKNAAFTAYYQDATVPAMGMAYEGIRNPDGKDKVSYLELMEDDGRDVLHIHHYNSTWRSDEKRFMNDVRVHLKSGAIDPNEYNVIQYMYKIPKAVNLNTLNTPPEQLTEENFTYPSEIDMILYYYTSKGFYGSPEGEHRVGNKVHKLPVDNDYHVLEVDMGVAANSNGSHPWNYDSIYGFALDGNRAFWAGDLYIDYLRIYRDGIFTVNYDTNVPEEVADYASEVILKEVEPDTGRGLGTGYLLKGDRPILDGYVFRGWALTPDATADEVVDVVDLTGDLTVYAVWDYDYLTMPNDAENTVNIRSGKDGVNGIRFRATIEPDTKEFVDEYGFIIARKDVLDEKGAELTFDFKADGENKPLYVYGAAYIKGEKDKQYAIDDSGVVTFTAVCVGVPAEHFTTPLVARPYTKYSNKNGLSFTVYGEGKTASIAEVAQSIKDAGGEAYESNKEYIDSILG